MIAKCIAILAVVAQINAAVCNQQTLVVPTTGSCSQSSQVGVLSSGSSDVSSSGAITRNIVAKGKYPVALRNCGPTPDRQIPVTTSHVTAPTQERPTVRLPCSIPAPRVVSHTCTCYKTIMRPRVNQQIITVPTVQRYIETTHKPVIENIQYEAEPVNCGESNENNQVQFVEVGSSGSSSSGSSSQVVVPSSSSCETSAPVVQTCSSCGSTQVVIPSTPTVCASQAQSIRVPEIQTVQVPQCQSIRVPEIQTVQVPQCQSIRVPEIQTVQVPQCQSIRVPEIQTVQVPQSFTVGSSCNSCN